LLMAAVGCGGGEKKDREYPAQVQRNFVNSCVSSGGTTTSCNCALNKIEEKLSFDAYKKEETAIAAGRTPSRKITDSVAECR